MTFNTHKVGKELKSWVGLKDILSSDDLDEQTLIDTLDGETELFEVVCAIKESAMSDAAAIEGIDQYIKKLNARKTRIETGMKAKDALILSTMEIANIPQVKGPLFTISKRHTPPKVIINDEAEIPSRYFKQPDPVLDKKALKGALKDGEVSGAQLSNGGITLSTRIV